jgi:hypothetical protein
LIYADRDEASNFIVSENEIVRLGNRDPELLAGALYQLNEVPVTQVHASLQSRELAYQGQRRRQSTELSR